jgi:hypothetical protein
MLSRVFHRRRRGRICIESLLKARQSHEISHPFFHHSIPIPFSAQATLPCADNDKGEHEKIAAVFPLIFYLFCFNVMRLRRIFLFHHSKRQQSTRQNSFFFREREMCAEMVCLCTLKILSAIASLFPPRLSLKCENKFSIRRMFGLRPSSSNDGVNVLVAPLIRCFLAISEVEFLIALSRNPIEHKNANREVEGRQTDGKIVYKYWKKARRTLAAYLIASPRH